MTELNYDQLLNPAYSEVCHMNSYVRTARTRQWVYTLFIVDDSADGSGTTAGDGSYAYRNGPYTTMVWPNWRGGSRFGWVFAHETGHIFDALDEYGPGGTDPGCGANHTSGFKNSNSEYCTGTLVDCPMRQNLTDANTIDREQNICYWTRGMIRWGPTSANLLRVRYLPRTASLEIVWDQPRKFTILGWNVYRSEDGENFSKLNKMLLPPDETRFVDRSAKKGIQCYYRVEEVNEGKARFYHDGDAVVYQGLSRVDQHANSEK